MNIIEIRDRVIATLVTPFALIHQYRYNRARKAYEIRNLEIMMKEWREAIADEVTEIALDENRPSTMLNDLIEEYNHMNDSHENLIVK